MTNVTTNTTTPILVDAGAQIAGPIVGAVVKGVWEFGAARIRAVAEAEAKNARAAITYLEVAHDAMLALEAEASDVLLTTMQIRRVNKHQDKAAAKVVASIERMAYREELRPLIAKCAGSLTSCVATLRDDAVGFFGKPPKQDINELLGELEKEVTYLADYVEWLQMQGDGASGAWINSLMQLRALLEKGKYDEAASDALGLLQNREPLAVQRAADIGWLVEELRSQLAN